MFVDICWHCNGTGERNIFSGERCLECNGRGIIEDDEDYDRTDEERDLDEDQMGRPYDDPDFGWT